MPKSYRIVFWIRIGPDESDILTLEVDEDESD
jgi:hypothetical protein